MAAQRSKCCRVQLRGTDGSAHDDKSNSFLRLQFRNWNVVPSLNNVVSCTYERASLRRDKPRPIYDHSGVDDQKPSSY